MQGGQGTCAPMSRCLYRVQGIIQTDSLWGVLIGDFKKPAGVLGGHAVTERW
jgi:hypothetical protein